MLLIKVIIFLALTIGSTICAPVQTQIASYNGIQNVNDFEQSPFEKIGDSYYIIETTEYLNWFAAAHKCRRKGANLVSIESEDEMRALQEHLKAKYRGNYSFWLSGNDLSEENHFQWLSTGQSMKYTSWGDKQPDNANGSENCVHLRYDPSDGLFKFNDLPCTDSLKYICEADNPKQISIIMW